MICKNCGATMSEDARFCPACGTKVETDTAGAENANAEAASNAGTAQFGSAASNAGAPPYGSAARQAGSGYSTARRPSSAAYVPEGNAKGLGIAGLVLGICSIAFQVLWVAALGFLAIPCGVVGLILSIKSLNYGPYNLAKAGKITSIIGLALSAAALLLCVCLVGLASCVSLNFIL